MHGANRLGGNGVANSTVFGGLAGDAMAAKLRSRRSARRSRQGGDRGGARARLGAARPQARRSRSGARGGSTSDVGRRRHPAHRRGPRARPARARTTLATTSLADAAWPTPSRRYNLTWMDRLNLENLMLVSRAICAAAQARNDSRGAHYREDFPGSLRAFARLATRSCGQGRRLHVHHRAGEFHARAAR